MRLFIHMAYGSATVFDVSTPEKLRQAYFKFIEVFEDFFDKSEFESLFGPLHIDDPRNDDRVITERDFVNAIDAFGGHHVHENLEHPTGFTNLV